jgi:hypothetical protein
MTTLSPAARSRANFRLTLTRSLAKAPTPQATRCHPRRGFAGLVSVTRGLYQKPNAAGQYSGRQQQVARY